MHHPKCKAAAEATSIEPPSATTIAPTSFFVCVCAGAVNRAQQGCQRFWVHVTHTTAPCIKAPKHQRHFPLYPGSPSQRMRIRVTAVHDRSAEHLAVDGCQERSGLHLRLRDIKVMLQAGCPVIVAPWQAGC